MKAIVYIVSKLAVVASLSIPMAAPDIGAAGSASPQPARPGVVEETPSLLSDDELDERSWKVAALGKRVRNRTVTPKLYENEMEYLKKEFKKQAKQGYPLVTRVYDVCAKGVVHVGLDKNAVLAGYPYNKLVLRVMNIICITQLEEILEEIAPLLNEKREAMM